MRMGEAVVHRSAVKEFMSLFYKLFEVALCVG
jgi:hypothetical protein